MRNFEQDLKRMMNHPAFPFWCSASLAVVMENKGKFDRTKLKSFNVSYNPTRIEYPGELGMYPPGTEYLYNLLKEEVQQAML